MAKVNTKANQLIPAIDLNSWGWGRAPASPWPLPPAPVRALQHGPAMDCGPLGGSHYLGDKGGDLPNGSVAVVAKIIKNVMASAAGAGVGALPMGAQLAALVRVTLGELGSPQPATPMGTGNSTASGRINGPIKQQRSKAIGMRPYWL